MELSIFFAKFFGIYFLISAVFWTFLKKQTRAAAFAILNSEGLVRFTGILLLIAGLILIIAHPKISHDLHVWLVVLGVILVLSGIWRLFFYTHFKVTAIRMIDGRWYYVNTAIFWMAGFYLTYLGFTTHPASLFFHF